MKRLNRISKSLAMVAMMLVGSWSTRASAQTWSSPQSAGNGSSALAAATYGHGTSAIVVGLTSVIVQTSGVWHAPVTLSSSPNSEANVAVAPNGDILVVWSSRTGNSYLPITAQAAFYSSGHWGSPVTLSSNVYGNVSSRGLPGIAFDGNSNATLIWEEVVNPSPLGCGLKTVTGTAASGFATVRTISTATTCFGWSRLAVNNSGQAVAVQGAAGILSGAVVAISRDANGNWSAPVTVGAAGVYRQRQPKVGLGNDGSAVLLWLTNAGVRYSVRSNGAWSAATALLSGGAGGTADLAVDGAGNAVALFTQTGIGAGGYSIYRPAGGTFEPKVALPSGSDLQVVASRGGTFVIGGQTVSTRLAGSSTWNSTSFTAADSTVVAVGGNQAMVVLEGTSSSQLLVSTATIP
jgi:hypothetical protein